MKTIKIKNQDCEYMFFYDLNHYKLYENNKLIHEIVDTGNGFILNDKELSYSKFADLFVFFRCIHHVDKNILGEFDAVTEEVIFKI